MMLNMRLYDCGSLPEKARSGVQLLEILRSSGAKLLNTDYGFDEKNTEKWITEEGNTYIPRGLEHALLGKGAYHYQKTLAPTREHGTGGFSYIHADRGRVLRQFTLDQTLKEKNPGHWNDIARRQLDFVRMMYRHLRPRFGWIDEFGDSETTNRLIQGRPRVLFWANIYGPDLVQQLGKTFLLKAPGWKKDELDDGGILYVVESEYHEWHANPSKEALRYFQKKIPQMRLYRAKPVGLPEELVRMVVTDEETGKETVVYERGRTPKGKRK